MGIDQQSLILIKLKKKEKKEKSLIWYAFRPYQHLLIKTHILSVCRSTSGHQGIYLKYSGQSS